MQYKTGVLFLTLCYLISVVSGFVPEVTSITHEKFSSALLYFDDSANVLNLNDGKVALSKNDGKEWKNIEELPESITGLWSDSIDRHRAFAFTDSNVHYITNDRGEHWSSIKFDVSSSADVHIQTNFANSKLVLVRIHDCEVASGGDLRFNRKCVPKMFYTDNGFLSDAKPLDVQNVLTCTFAKTNENFNVGSDNRVLCITREYDSSKFVKATAIYESSDWFKSSTLIDDDRGILSSSYVLELHVVESFVVAVVQVDKYNKYSQIDFYVSKDGSRFKKANFNVDMKRSMYMILPSTPNSLHIVAWSYKNSHDSFPLADIYRSDSSGLYYTKSASSILGGMMGDAAIDKVQNIDGVWIANEVLGTSALNLPNLKSRISIDDGLTWDVLKVTDQDCSNDEKCSLNILSTKERDGEGKLVTGPTPGILMGVGNVGAHSANLLDILKSQTYISRDGGLHWKKALDSPCAFAFGDQGNIIVAFPYAKAPESDKEKMAYQTETIYYSLDQGDTWESYDLGKKIFPVTLTTTIDGSSKKFILVGLYDSGEKKNVFDATKSREIIYSIDFNGAHNGEVCKERDFEDWYARAKDGKTGSCLFGHKEKFSRRKQDAKCFVSKLFDDVKTIEESCECSAEDFECALGFVKNESGECEADVKIIANNYCLKGKTGKIRLPVRQKIPGSLCKGGMSLDDTKQEFNCKDILEADKSAAISTKTQSFPGSIAQYYYLKESLNTSLSDETLILRTSDNYIYYSFNGGESFYKFDSLEDPSDEFVAVYLNPFFHDQIYLITSNSKIYVSLDRGINYVVHHAPSEVNELGLKFLSFSKSDPLKFIWYGEKNCGNFFDENCKSMAYLTNDGGSSFSPLLEDVRNCYYVGSIFDNKKYLVDKDQIFCEQKVKGTNHLALLSSNDNFDKNKEVLFKSIVGFAVTGEFVVVASVNIEQKSLEAYVTVNGKDFAEALFPPDFHVDRQQAYTIVDSSTKALFFHVTTNAAKNGEYGTLLKSNSNGTLYVKSIENVNRNGYGYVDYEKVEGLEGVSLVNIVDNAHDVLSKKTGKKLKTMITHNDGSEWNFLVPPLVDSDNNKYGCSGSALEKCSLSLHGYTQRADVRDTYSSGSAIGMLVGVGNVGEHLLDFDDKDTSTFMTKDGGVTWREIKKGNYMWEYGDQGTILVLAPNDHKPADTISFSLDEGDTWNDFKFVDEPVTILDLATVPSDTARRFLIFARNSANVLVAITLDFTNIHERQCKLNFDDPASDDFEYWTPKHPFSADNCLFGHESMYLRRISSHSDCFIGSAPLNYAYKELRDCQCTRKDYECDYNYVRAGDGTCKLVDGLSPPDNINTCALDPNITEYWEPTGYRKVPLSTCKNGKELDKWISHPCPGKESEFKQKYTIKGFALFLVVFIPVAVFIGATWFVYDRGVRRNGGFSRFGEIRLDEDDFHPIENNKTDKIINDIVKGVILAIGAVITFRSIVKTKITELFTRRNRYEGLFGQSHDGILDDDSLFNFNDIDNDDDANEIDSFIQQNDDDFNTVATGEEYSDDVDAKSSGEPVEGVEGNEEEDDVTNQGSS